MSQERNDTSVFVIDGDSKHRKSVCELVEGMNLPVRPFASAGAFRRAFQTARPSCLVSDLQVLGIGRELEQAIADDGQSHALVVASGHMVPVILDAIENGTFTWLRRPYRDPQLTGAIENALMADTHHHETRRRVREIQARMAHLTKGEREVLDLMIEGKPNKAIARRLSVTPRTVERRRRSILEKMNAKSLLEIVLMVAEAAEPK